MQTNLEELRRQNDRFKLQIENLAVTFNKLKGNSQTSFLVSLRSLLGNTNETELSNTIMNLIGAITTAEHNIFDCLQDVSNTIDAACSNYGDSYSQANQKYNETKDVLAGLSWE